MTRQRIIAKLRQHDYFKPMLLELEHAGITAYEILPPHGKGHAILAFERDGHRVRLPLPTSPAGDTRYVLARIRRALR